MRLGLPIPGIIIPGKCLCKHGSNDIYGYHLLSVCNKGNQRISYHRYKSRVDAICGNFLPGIPMAFDHSIADPRQSGLSLKPIPGKAAKKKESFKSE